MIKFWVAEFAKNSHNRYIQPRGDQLIKLTIVVILKRKIVFKAIKSRCLNCLVETAYGLRDE